jgi:LmbE family N-acetylglucosaminyl deacetylase
MFTARRLQAEIGGEIVFFYHDSDHDPRETQTTLRNRQVRRAAHAQLHVREQAPAQVLPALRQARSRGLARQHGPPASGLRRPAGSTPSGGWRRERGRLLPGDVRADGPARGGPRRALGGPAFRRAACDVADFFVDVPHEGEIVRARFVDGALQLHEGGGSFVTLPPMPFDKSQISPARDSRLRWMQSVLHCTHYVAGAGEQAYLRREDAPEVTFVDRDPSTDPMKPTAKSRLNSRRCWPSARIPDDIEFGCGGIIARETRAGRKAHFVVCSRGESATHGTPEVRAQEARGRPPPSSARPLNSSSWTATPSSRSRPSPCDQAGRRHPARAPGVVLAPTPVENQHPDHPRLGRLVRDAARLARYGGVARLRAAPAHAIGPLLLLRGDPRGRAGRRPCPLLMDISAPEVSRRGPRPWRRTPRSCSTRNYVELQLARAREQGLRAGVEHAQPLYPQRPARLRLAHAPLTRAARRF